MTEELFSKEISKLDKFVNLLVSHKKNQIMNSKKGSNSESQKKEIEENILIIEELLQNLAIMVGLIIGVQKSDNEMQKEIVYKNAKKMLKEMKEILSS
jgi:hypothetical protein